MTTRHHRRRRGAPLYHAPSSVTYARQMAGLSQRDLAARLGISRQLMSDIEAGRRNLTPPNLRKMAQILRCPLEVLLAASDTADLIKKS